MDPPTRRSVVGDLVRERERRQAVEGNLQQSQELLRQVMSLPGGMELVQAPRSAGPRRQARPAQRRGPALYAEARRSRATWASTTPRASPI